MKAKRALGPWSREIWFYISLRSETPSNFFDMQKEDNCDGVSGVCGRCDKVQIIIHSSNTRHFIWSPANQCQQANVYMAGKKTFLNKALHNSRGNNGVVCFAVIVRAIAWSCILLVRSGGREQFHFRPSVNHCYQPAAGPDTYWIVNYGLFYFEPNCASLTVLAEHLELRSISHQRPLLNLNPPLGMTWCLASDSNVRNILEYRCARFCIHSAL